jgi:hypothetical protein
MPNYADDWKLDSGLRESMDLTIHSSYFSTSADYQGGRVYMLFLLGEDENGDPQELRLSVGSDWSSADGGQTITHPTRRHINKNSIYGHWIQNAIELEDVVDGTTLRDVLVNRETPMYAELWIGIKLHLDLVEIKFGRNIDPMERLLPTKYLGIYSEQPLQPPTAPATLPLASTPAAPSPAEVVAQAKAASAVTANGQSPLYQEMLDLARGSASHAEFQSAAFARADVLADEELAIQVADQAAGIWPLAKS